MAQSDIQTFGKYQILEKIATGGMAEIYKARLEGIGGFQRTFAIKRILPNLSQNSEYIAMLVDEAKVAGLLSHANIVQILDLGQVDGVWYIAMEYVHGRDLGGVLRRARSKGLWLPVPHTVFIAIELLKGLEYAHQRQVMRGGRQVALNIIHRDVSPPNVLLSFQGEVKLTDFGIARASLKAMETISGLIRGRFDYMSPEQAAGAKDLDQRSDLFSVGVVLYEMLTGTHPFRADNEIATIERIRTGQYVPVSKRNAEVPFPLEAIVDRSLRVDRNERYPSATAFKEALDKFFHESGFIFTHANLASYVKGLFPEAQPKPGGPPGPQRTRHRRASEETDEVELEPEEDPTRRHDHPGRASDARVITATTTRPGDPETTASGQLIRDITENGRRGQTEWDDVATQLRPNPFETEQETVIRRATDDDVAPPLPASVPPPPETTRTSGKIRTASGKSLPGKTSNSGKSASGRRAAPARGVGVLGYALGAGGLFTGLVVGAMLTVIVGWFAGFRPESTLPDPTLRVVAPPGTSVKLNGDAIGGTASVHAGEPQHLEITLAGYKPWTQEVTLQPAEQRILVVSVEALQKNPPAPAPAPAPTPKPAPKRNR